MGLNQINLTEEISIPKGNFDFVYEATHNERLYLECLYAEQHMLTDYDECLKGLRKSLDMLGIEIEKCKRAQKNEVTPQEALRSIFIDLKRLKGGRGDRRRATKRNFFIRHMIDFEKQELEVYTSDQIRKFIDEYREIYPYGIKNHELKNTDMKSVANDFYNRCSVPFREKGCAKASDCANLIRLFHGLLCFINYVDEPYDPDLTPYEDYYPIPAEYYDELDLLGGSNYRIYVSGDGSRYFMFKRKDIEYMDILDPDIYRERLWELEKMQELWRRLATLPDYKPYEEVETGTYDHRRKVFEFVSRPRALSERVIKEMKKKGQREELVRGLIRMLKLMFGSEPPLTHLSINPGNIYVCENEGVYIPYIVDFDEKSILLKKREYPARGRVEDYFNSMDKLKFIAPEIRNNPDTIPENTRAAGMYSLGKIIKYIYGSDENKVKSYVEELTVKNPAKRMSIERAGISFDEEVVYFEPTTTINLDFLTEFRLLIFSPYKGFENYHISDTVSIGRMYSSSGKDIKVDSPIVSRTHGRFAKTEGGFEYSDMLSTNGTFINGSLFSVPRNGIKHPHKLEIGDILKIDNPDFKNTHRNAVFMFVLRTSQILMQQHEILLEEDMDILVGREQGDIILANNRVSKQHARFVMKEGIVYIQDMNSTNGVFVNGKRIDSLTALNNMDSVRIEDYIFILVNNKIYYYSERF
ncbi:MAG: FHA domain-containing protein [Lachnospiraceae bacterium]|nr:FHA domain-containing protein [Lachnospiraceae bacterium]